MDWETGFVTGCSNAELARTARIGDRTVTRVKTWAIGTGLLVEAESGASAEFLGTAHGRTPTYAFYRPTGIAAAADDADLDADPAGPDGAGDGGPDGGPDGAAAGGSRRDGGPRRADEVPGVVRDGPLRPSGPVVPVRDSDDQRPLARAAGDGPDGAVPGGNPRDDQHRTVQDCQDGTGATPGHPGRTCVGAPEDTPAAAAQAHAHQQPPYVPAASSLTCDNDEIGDLPHLQWDLQPSHAQGEQPNRAARGQLRPDGQRPADSQSSPPAPGSQPGGAAEPARPWPLYATPNSPAERERALDRFLELLGLAPASIRRSTRHSLRGLLRPWWDDDMTPAALLHAVAHHPDRPGAQRSPLTSGARDLAAVIGHRLQPWRGRVDEIPDRLFRTRTPRIATTIAADSALQDNLRRAHQLAAGHATQDPARDPAGRGATPAGPSRAAHDAPAWRPGPETAAAPPPGRLEVQRVLDDIARRRAQSHRPGGRGTHPGRSRPRT